MTYYIHQLRLWLHQVGLSPRRARLWLLDARIGWHMAARDEARLEMRERAALVDRLSAKYEELSREAK